MNLTEDQKKELKSIMGDGYKEGPFAGMIFNAVWAKGADATDDVIDALIDEATSVALTTRIKLKKAVDLWRPFQ